MKLGFLGGGRMAEAMVSGILKKNFLPSSSISVFDINETRRYLFKEMKVQVYQTRKELFNFSDYIVLAVKPDQVSERLRNLSSDYNLRKPLIVSICAGLTLYSLQIQLPIRSRLIRVMANTPCLVGETAAVISPGEFATSEDVEKMTSLFSTLGVVFSLPEKFLDIVTGLSGSGPAFVFTFIEAMTDAGVLHGLPRHIARQLAVQTVYGSSKMALHFPQTHLAQLRNQVESPGGTTISGTASLEKNGFRHSVIDAISKATEKSKSLIVKK